MTYTCVHCKGVFEKGWSDEEAQAEAQDVWGVKGAASDSRMVLVCDDCFQKMHPDKFPEFRNAAIERMGE